MFIEDVQAVGMVFHVLDTLVVCEDSQDCDLSVSACFYSSVSILSLWTGCSRVESGIATGSEEREEGREGVLEVPSQACFRRIAKARGLPSHS